jgi:hypothetical protein
MHFFSINEKTGNGSSACAQLRLDKIFNAQVQNLGEKMRKYNIKAKSAEDPIMYV